MSVKFSNNGHSTLASSLTSSATSITVASGHGARFPSLTGSEYFYATLIDSSNNLEIVKVTARSSDVLTATRAQESTTARAYAIGDRIELRVTAAGLVDATALDAVVADNSITAAKINVSGNGTSGQALLSDGDGSFSYGDAGGGLQSQQVFTSSGTYTKPSGIKKIKVYVTGGGGAGGGGANQSQDYGGGGGAGGTAIEIIDVSSLSSTVAVTIGAGASSVTGSSEGGDGGTSSFGSYCSATGGGGGRHGNQGNCRGGEGGIGSGGDINIYGQAGGGGDDGGSTHMASGTGGASFYGGGGLGGAQNQQGTSAQRSGYLGAGGGGSNNAVSSGAGGTGIVVVEEYK